jgi:hypothetical protein
MDDDQHLLFFRSTKGIFSFSRRRRILLPNILDSRQHSNNDNKNVCDSVEDEWEEDRFPSNTHSISTIIMGKNFPETFPIYFDSNKNKYSHLVLADNSSFG